MWQKRCYFLSYNRSSVNADNRRENILVLDEGLVDGLDNTTIVGGAKYLINITRCIKKIV